MWSKALEFKIQGFNVVADFVCPTPAARELFPADYTIWMDTITVGRYADTNQMIDAPPECNYHVCEWFDDTHAELIRVIKTYMERNNV